MKNKKDEMVSNDQKNSDKNDSIEIPNYFNKVRANPWMASTIVLGLVLILVLAFGTGQRSISADAAGEKVISYLNSNPAIAGDVSLVSTEKQGQFYEVMLNYQGQQVPVYATLDGEFLVGNPVALDETTDTTQTTDSQTQTQVDTTIPKTDKPKVELFVMSYCPFGTQEEKGILPVVRTLGDKIDFEIKFVDYAMHGEDEVWENTRQYCIQSEQNDKYLDYLQCFLEAGDSDGCLASTGVNKAKLDACVKKTDTKFEITKNFQDQSKWLSGRYPQYNTHKTENEQYGVQGSPTLVINGKQASSGRDPASLLGTICGAFNTAPEECSTELASASPSPGFGWSTTAADSAALAQCG